MVLFRTSQLTSIDLFAGAGGLALGIHQSGLSSVGLVEFNRQACETLRRNATSAEIGTDWPVLETDARLVNYHALADSVDLLAGGAPCQPFSLGGKHRGDEDGRNMFPEVFRAIRALRPKAIVLENVRGLTRQSFRPYFEYILSQLTCPHRPPLSHESWSDHAARLETIVRHEEDEDPAESYDVHWRLVNSADYGVPQKRERVIMVAFRRDLDITWTFPRPTHSEDRLLYDQYVTGEYWSRHNLVQDEPSARLANRIERLRDHGVVQLDWPALRDTAPGPLPWRTLREAIAGLPQPIDGVECAGWTFHIGIPGARIYQGHTGNDLDKPAKTIKAGDHGNPGGEHIIVRDDGGLRYMTVRECARVQDFPDAYQFAGTRTEAMRQIGNAVPVGLARVLTASIRDALVDQAAMETVENDIAIAVSA